MKKNISRNPLWPDWYNGKKIDEVQFGRAFLEQWPLKCVNGTLYTLDGPVEDESEIKQRILENIEEYVTSGLSKKVTNILETIKLLAFSDPFPIEQDCIHLQNGVYHLPDGSFQESRLFCQNRLPVRYDPKAASPDRWLTFLHELLDDADIPTLQEYLGYCLIPSTKGQKMMLIVGKGGEGKSRIGLVLKRLMGDAASNGSVQKVENNRFARADLERRLLMIDDDMDMNALPKTNYIKTIVTAEAKLDLERKGVQSYQRDIYARFLCFGNGALTSLYDHSDGFFRRQLILTTKDKPADRTDDPFLVEKMCAEFLLDALTNWLKEMLVGGIMGNLSGMFDSVNQQVADISVQVGQTPQGWNGSIFSMIQNLSNSIMVPIAGVILAIVMTLELIQMITDRNNLHDVDTWMIFKWVFKSAAAILLVTNTWNLVMGVFDMAQSVVAQASGIIGSDASIDISAVMTDMESRLMDMDLGPLFGLWFQSLFIGITMWALYICIFIVIYGRMIEIYRASRSAACNPQAVRGHFGNPALASR